ncbi:MAG: hypothetical protein WAV32_03920 [Halobacteriota archaeon]
MDMSLFLFGALGAILTVYLAKQEVIPEFRPLFEISEKEKEVIEHQDHIRMQKRWNLTRQMVEKDMKGVL